MADIKKLAEEIVGLTLLEAVELKNLLKDEYGIEPAAGGAVMMAECGAPGGIPGGAERPEVVGRAPTAELGCLHVGCLFFVCARVGAGRRGCVCLLVCDGVPGDRRGVS